jgi:hypothetical protein
VFFYETFYEISLPCEFLPYEHDVGLLLQLHFQLLHFQLLRFLLQLYFLLEPVLVHRLLVLQLGVLQLPEQD